MNAYRFNQIAMAVLGALLLFFGAKTIVNIAFEEPEEKPGYEVPGTEAGNKPEGEKPGGQRSRHAAGEGRLRSTARRSRRNAASATTSRRAVPT